MLMTETRMLERVMTDPMVIPPPVPLSPVSSMELGLFPVCLSRDDTMVESEDSGRTYLPVRDSFRMVSEVVSSLESESSGDTASVPISGESDSCQSNAADQTEATPNGGLTRLSTITVCQELMAPNEALKKQASDVSFISAVMAPPSFIPMTSSDVDQNNEAPPTFVRPAPVKRTDTDETMSPPPQLVAPLRSWLSWNRHELDCDSEATPTNSQPAFATPPKPALTRLVPIEAEEEMDTHEIEKLSNDEPKVVKDHPDLGKSKSCLNARRSSRCREARSAKPKVTFRKLVKINTAGESELPEVGTSRIERRRQQQKSRSREDRDKKTWFMRASTTAKRQASIQKSSKVQVSTQSIKKPNKAYRESLTPARFFLETKLDWTPWQPCILTSPLTSTWQPSALLDSGFVNPGLFQNAPSVGRPTMYEVAVQPPKALKKHVVFSKVVDSSRLNVPCENFILQGQKHLKPQIMDVLRQGCKVYIRRGILPRKLTLPAGTTKIQISDAHQLRALSRQICDYAWHLRADGSKGQTRRDCVSRGVIISNSLV